MINILFVCVGNTCRSVMCEYLFKHMISKQNLSSKFNIKSCGIFALNNQPASNNVIKIIKNFNIDIKKHKSQIISLELIKNSNYIFALDNFVFQYINNTFIDHIPQNISCISNLNISDPYGTSLENYKLCYDNIKKCLENILDRIIKNEKL